MASSSSHNRNPKGKNPFDPVCESGFLISNVQLLIFFGTVTADSPILQEALKKYHRQLITDNNRISEPLLADHNIEMKLINVFPFFAF
jgi:hypothetical protein